MTQRPFTLITAVSLAGLAVFLGVLQSLFGAAGPARALAGDGHGPGYLSSDGWWLGAYHFDDGALGFCLNPGKLAPTGLTYTYADPAGMGWWTPEQSAIFAYIARTWAGSPDRLTAAAGQLATWMYAGMSDVDAQNHAGRAGADTDAVYARALDMLAEARSRASTGVRAAAVVELAESGPGRVRVELTVDRITGAEVLPPGAHPVSVTLTGAAFAGGSSTATIRSGTDVDITPTGRDASVSVTATARSGDLPYGNRLTVALPTVDAQAVLIAQSATAATQAEAHTTGPSPLPFQPRVQTTTSDAEARPGAEITDHLTVTVDDAEGLLPAWGVQSASDGFTPVTVVVESTLYGPFAEPIVPAAAPPPDAPSVCTVETVVDGAGDYTTPACAVPEDGYYVWTERIDPARTGPAAVAGRVRPWVSEFGIASEVTHVQTAVVETHTPPTSTPAPTPPAAVVPAPTAPPTGTAAMTPTALAETGSDVLAPALGGVGAGAVGVALLASRRLRAWRSGDRSSRRLSGPRRARTTWIRL
ncbi:hypothetical protein [Leifsonia sp. fls2-241-R2A-40a]|uniref:hypothetical protein n=1 Tax=Leifsonia sp. fls2-241-R2A-40a TaxID=3040290 RepID=UPI00254C6FED|nr:hypothetical protein [Leifsonia sp. fls2-241-R2A-40a]